MSLVRLGNLSPANDPLARGTEGAIFPSGPDEHDGMVRNTRLIQDALDSVCAAGGGRVEVPPGVWWIRTIKLPEYVDLHLHSGACLRAWPYISDYPKTVRTNQDASADWHENVFSGYPLIAAHDVASVSISGHGTIDGNGFAFWDIPLREAMAEGHTRESLGLESHWEDDSPFWREKEMRISPMIEFDNCRGILMRDVHVIASPGWTIHAYCCEQATFDGITIKNHLYGPNTDGIDINGCRDTVVRACRISCGDDAVILKATQDARACERTVVSDCIIETHCAAIGIGAEVSYPIRDVVVSGIVVARALRMVQIELWEAGLVENVVVSGMVGSNITDIPLERPLYIDIQHFHRTDGALGAVRNVQFRGISAVTRGRCLFTAADGATIEGLIVDGLQLTIPEIEDPHVSVPASRSNQMSNSSPRTRSVRAAVVADNVHNAIFRNIQIRWPDKDRAEAASLTRGSLDRGDLTRDRRKQESLHGDVPMHALFMRRCSGITWDAPEVNGFGADAIASVSE